LFGTPNFPSTCIEFFGGWQMAAVARLIRNAPRGSLQAFFDAQKCPLGDRLRDLGPDDDYAGPLLKSVDQLSDEEHARLTVNAERVDQLATEAGRTALLSVVDDQLLVMELENDYDRSLWVFLNEPHSFRRAEEARYTDERRHGRMWSGYTGPKKVVPDTSPGGLEAFRSKALELVGSLGAYCEIYRRTRANFGKPDSELHQLTLYYDDLPDICPSPSSQSRGRAACRQASTSAARRTPPPGACSPSRSPTTSMGQFTDDAQHSPQACPQFGGCSLMIDLAQRSEPYEIPLPYGLSVTVKPLTTAGMAAAQVAARRAVEAIERQVRERMETGLPLDGLPDLSAEGERDGFYQAQLIRELAVRHIISWTGVEIGGGPAPPTPENIAAVMELYPVGDRFFQEFTLRQVLLNAAKNGYGPSAAGTSSRVEGPSTAGPAATMAWLAPEASQEPTAGSVPTASTP
jgi:hypothetical protein